MFVRQHPELRFTLPPGTITHTLESQKEVILKPIDTVLDAIAHAEAGCPSTDELNRRFSGPDIGPGIITFGLGLRSNPEICDTCGGYR